MGNLKQKIIKPQSSRRKEEKKIGLWIRGYGLCEGMKKEIDKEEIRKCIEIRD